MMAFFFTMPISSTMPISAMTERSWPDQHQREQRADAGRRQRGEDRERMDEALVQHAEHDVDRHDRRRGSATARRRATSRTPRCRPNSCRSPMSACRSTRSADEMIVDRVAQRRAGREIEAERHRGELLLVRDRERRGGADHLGEGARAAPACSTGPARSSTAAGCSARSRTAAAGSGCSPAHRSSSAPRDRADTAARLRGSRGTGSPARRSWKSAAGRTRR